MISIERLQEFRKHLLDLAIKGKLVEQRPEDGTAEELYAKILEDKKKQFAEGKLKKVMPFAEIKDDEIPFDIPKTWKWLRIGNVFPTSSGSTPNTSKKEYYENGKYNWVRTTDLNNGILSDCEIKISEQARIDCNLSILPQNSVCIAMYGGAGTIGKNALIKFDTTINQSVFAIHPNHFIDMKYIFYFIQFNRKRWIKYSVGTRKDPNINGLVIKKALFPLPPLAEQKRIVAKLESYLAVIDKAEELIERKANLDEEIRNKILDLAIRGKLVEQRPEEGTAEELFAQIQEEKKKLIAEGKIKKAKTLPEIKDEEIPFEIPRSWKWYRIGEIYYINMGQSPDGNTISTNDNEIEFHQGRTFFGDIYINKSNTTTSCPLKIAEKNSVLLCVRAPVGDVNITKRKICIGRGLCSISSFIETDIKFLYYFLKPLEKSFKNKSTGTTFKAIGKDDIQNQLIPLPPLAEQKRIVDKIEELLPYCEKLK